MKHLLLFSLTILLLGCKKENIESEAFNEFLECGQLNNLTQVTLIENIVPSGGWPIYHYLGFTIEASGENNEQIIITPGEVAIDTTISISVASGNLEGSVLFPSFAVCGPQEWHDIVDGDLIMKDSTSFFDSIGIVFIKRHIYARLENATYINDEGTLSTIETLEFNNLSFSYMY